MNAKLAEILALATDITWSVSLSDQQDHMGVYAKSERLPGCWGLHIDSLWASTVWRVRPATSSLRQEEAAFWQRFSTRDGDPFAGFELTTADLAIVLPSPQLGAVLDGLRSIAARREASAFQDTVTARNLRAVIREHDRSWACPVRTADGQFEDPGHRLRVEPLREQDEWRPAGCWVLREIGGYPRSWFLPGWWATRRAADDEARRVLARKTAGKSG